MCILNKSCFGKKDIFAIRQDLLHSATGQKPEVNIKLRWVCVHPLSIPCVCQRERERECVCVCVCEQKYVFLGPTSKIYLPIKFENASKQWLKSASTEMININYFHDQVYLLC